MEKILNKESFPKWLDKLQAYRVYTPTRDKDNANWTYETIAGRGSANLDPDFLNALQSAKKIIFPQKEIFLTFSSDNPKKEGYKIEEVLPDSQPTIIFGIRSCDARALTMMDKVFGGDFEDNYYWKRRKATVLVGLACNTPPSPNCFCLSVGGSPFSKDGLDIVMTDLGDAYLVETLTEKGKQIVQTAASEFTDAGDKEKKAARNLKEEAEEKITRQVQNPEKITAKLKEIFDTPFWETEAMSCISCGICTYLCPTCHCFDINDEVSSTAPLKGKRIRNWDNCQFPDFTMHSSGHNPRPNKGTRLRQRISHKYNYAVERYNDIQCTGCGRCVSKCPVGIDIIEVLNKVNEYAAK